MPASQGSAHGGASDGGSVVAFRREGRVRPLATRASRSREPRFGAGSVSSGEQYAIESIGLWYRKRGNRRRRLCATRHASVTWLRSTPTDDAAKVASKAQHDRTA